MSIIAVCASVNLNIYFWVLIPLNVLHVKARMLINSCQPAVLLAKVAEVKPLGLRPQIHLAVVAQPHPAQAAVIKCQKILSSQPAAVNWP